MNTNESKEMQAIDILANAVDEFVRFKSDEYEWAIEYIRNPDAEDFERLARLRLAHDISAVACISALAQWTAD